MAHGRGSSVAVVGQVLPAGQKPAHVAEICCLGSAEPRMPGAHRKGKCASSIGKRDGSVYPWVPSSCGQRFQSHGCTRERGWQVHFPLGQMVLDEQTDMAEHLLALMDAGRVGSLMSGSAVSAHASMAAWQAMAAGCDPVGHGLRSTWHTAFGSHRPAGIGKA